MWALIGSGTADRAVASKRNAGQNGLRLFLATLPNVSHCVGAPGECLNEWPTISGLDRRSTTCRHLKTWYYRNPRWSNHWTKPRPYRHRYPTCSDPFGSQQLLPRAVRTTMLVSSYKAPLIHPNDSSKQLSWSGHGSRTYPAAKHASSRTKRHPTVHVRNYLCTYEITNALRTHEAVQVDSNRLSAHSAIRPLPQRWTRQRTPIRTVCPRRWPGMTGCEHSVRSCLAYPY
jgi:hypothetical protein